MNKEKSKEKSFGDRVIRGEDEKKSEKTNKGNGKSISFVKLLFYLVVVVALFVAVASIFRIIDIDFAAIGVAIGGAMLTLVIIIGLYAWYIYTDVSPAWMGVLVSFSNPKRFVGSGWKFPFKPFQYIAIFFRGPQTHNYDHVKVSTRPGKQMEIVGGEEEEYVRTMEVTIDSTVYFEFPEDDALMNTLRYIGEIVKEASDLTAKVAKIIEDEVLSRIIAFAGDRTWQQCYWAKESFQTAINDSLTGEGESVVKRLCLKRFKVVITNVELPPEFMQALDDMETARVKKVAAIINASAKAVSLTIERAAIRATGLDIQAMLTMEEVSKGESVKMLIPFSEITDALQSAFKSGDPKLVEEGMGKVIQQRMEKLLEEKGVSEKVRADLKKAFEENL